MWLPAGMGQGTAVSTLSWDGQPLSCMPLPFELFGFVPITGGAFAFISVAVCGVGRGVGAPAYLQKSGDNFVVLVLLPSSGRQDQSLG